MTKYLRRQSKWCRESCPPARSAPRPRPPPPHERGPLRPSPRYRDWHRPRRPSSRGASLRRKAQRPVEANDLAVEVVVLDDALGKLGVLGRTSHPLRERHLRTPVLLELVCGLAIGGRVDCPGSDGVDADPQRRQV